MPLWNKTSKLPVYVKLLSEKRRTVMTDKGIFLNRTYTDAQGNARNKKEELVPLTTPANSTNFGTPAINSVWFLTTANTSNGTFNVYSGTNTNIKISFNQPVGYANSTQGTFQLAVANTVNGAAINAVSNTGITGANNHLNFFVTPVTAGTYTVQAQTITNATATAISSFVTTNASNVAPSYVIANSALTDIGTMTVTALLAATGTSVNTATHSVAYTGFTVGGTGGYTPYTFSSVGAAIPTGITLNSASGLFAGTPAANTAGTYAGIVLQVTDVQGHTANLTTFTLTVA